MSSTNLNPFDDPVEEYHDDEAMHVLSSLEQRDLVPRGTVNNLKRFHHASQLLDARRQLLNETLMKACREGDVNTVSLLLPLDLDMSECHVLYPADIATSPLMEAAAANHTEVLGLLLESGADLSVFIDIDRRSAPVFAARHNFTRRWLDCPYIGDTLRCTAITFAFMAAKSEAFDMLLSHFAHTNSKTNIRAESHEQLWHPLVLATWNKATDTVLNLLHVGAPPTRQVADTEHFASIVHLSALRHDARTLKSLSKRDKTVDLFYLPGALGLDDADTNRLGGPFASILHAAVYGALTTARMHVAPENVMRDFEKTLSLLARRVDIDTLDYDGQTPLHWAVLYASSNEHPGRDFNELRLNFDLVAALLATRANPNIQDRDGNTPLHIIAMRELKDPADATPSSGVPGYFAVIRELIAYGADCTLREYAKGQTPADIMGEKIGKLSKLRMMGPTAGEMKEARRLLEGKERQQRDGGAPDKTSRR